MDAAVKPVQTVRGQRRRWSDDRETGYLATPFQSTDLAFGIHWVLKAISLRANLSENARRKACTAFDINSVAKRDISLYEEVLRKGEEMG